jgi:hypothetical protein
VTSNEQTAQLEQGESDKTPKGNDEVWVFPPITLRRQFGDRLLDGQLGWNVTLPGRHVDPDLQAAAEETAAKVAARAAVDEELAALAAERERLMAELAKPDIEPGPEQVATREKLRDVVLDIEVARDFRVPELDRAIEASWYALSAAYNAVRASWTVYLRSKMQEATQALQVVLQGNRGVVLTAYAQDLVDRGLAFLLGELTLLDSLLAGEGIVQRDQSGATAASFARGQRSQSVNLILGGRDLGSEGALMGVSELQQSFAELAAPRVSEMAAQNRQPEEPKAEVEPQFYAHTVYAAGR